MDDSPSRSLDCNDRAGLRHSGALYNPGEWQFNEQWSWPHSDCNAPRTGALSLCPAKLGTSSRGNGSCAGRQNSCEGRLPPPEFCHRYTAASGAQYVLASKTVASSPEVAITVWD